MTQARPLGMDDFLLILAGLGLAGGLLALLLDAGGVAQWLWTLAVLPVLAALLVEIWQSLRRGDIGLDIVAALSMSAALAVGETLAAAVVALMYSGGKFLESHAQNRARREMQALMAQVPRVALRQRGEALEEIPLDEVVPGDHLLIRRGDRVPVDGILHSDSALLDTATLTGEPLPQRLRTGQEALSGATNVGEAFTLQATRPAQDSTYAGILRLVAQAQASKAPMSRLADRWALGFLVFTVITALAAWWVSGDPVRAVAVLVVATPCPLILAVPVALVGGVSRAARLGVLVKGAAPLEAMARVRVAILDKTGTLTEGLPKITAFTCAPGWDEGALLRLIGALEQATPHPMAKALVEEARARGLALPLPVAVKETLGEGITGEVEGRSVAVGSAAFVAAHLGHAQAKTPAQPGEVLIWAGVDGTFAGQITMSDPPRANIADVIRALRAGGVSRIIAASGDRPDVVARITEGLGLDEVHGGLSPAAKAALIARERAHGPVMMVGDGANDAPALAAADVGVAMGARGAAASAEAADVVLLTDSLERLVPGMVVARRARRIALESVAAGIGLSVLGMLAAAAGFLTPVQGALLQEAIDVAVILNSLRVLRIDPSRH